VMVENKGVDIDFTSGFSSMSVHYLGADSGDRAIDEASQNLCHFEMLRNCTSG
jgi:hypothetical protein